MTAHPSGLYPYPTRWLGCSSTDASAYCRAEVLRCLGSMDCPEYFLSVEKRIQAEQERAEQYLEPQSTRPKLLNSLVDVFVNKQARLASRLSILCAPPCRAVSLGRSCRTRVSTRPAVVQLSTVLAMERSGFVCLLDEDNIEVLARIYSIVYRIPQTGPKFIRGLMAEHIKAVGKARAHPSFRATAWCPPRTQLPGAASACGAGSLLPSRSEHTSHPLFALVCSASHLLVGAEDGGRERGGKGRSGVHPESAGRAQQVHADHQRSVRGRPCLHASPQLLLRGARPLRAPPRWVVHFGSLAR